MHSGTGWYLSLLLRLVLRTAAHPTLRNGGMRWIHSISLGITNLGAGPLLLGKRLTQSHRCVGDAVDDIYDSGPSGCGWGRDFVGGRRRTWWTCLAFAAVVFEMDGGSFLSGGTSKQSKYTQRIPSLN